MTTDPAHDGLKVTQEDRDAAADRLISPLISDWADHPAHQTATAIRAGKMDGHAWVQAFAAHRTATRANEDEEKDELILALKARDMGWSLQIEEERERATKAEAEVVRLREALTPSGDTKAAYIGEIKERIMQVDEFGDERWINHTISWDATKATMKMITDRAALRASDGGAA
jgi:hypothetical protein